MSSPRSDGDATPPEADREARRRASRLAGLCPECRHVHVVVSERGSSFLRCTRSRLDPAYPKYPPQPVVHCEGHEA